MSRPKLGKLLNQTWCMTLGALTAVFLHATYADVACFVVAWVVIDLLWGDWT